MKFVGIREAQARLSGLVEKSQKERIVLTRHGQPIAVLRGVRGEDLEDALLVEDPGFRKLIAARRVSKGSFVTQEELEAETKALLAKKEKPVRPPRRRGGRSRK